MKYLIILQDLLTRLKLLFPHLMHQYSKNIIILLFIHKNSLSFIFSVFQPIKMHLLIKKKSKLYIYYYSLFNLKLLYSNELADYNYLINK